MLCLYIINWHQQRFHLPLYVYCYNVVYIPTTDEVIDWADNLIVMLNICPMVSGYRSFSVSDHHVLPH